MNTVQWLQLALVIVGVLALAVLVWFVGPLVSVGSASPLESAWVRAGAIVLLMVAAVAGLAVAWLRRQAAIRSLADGIASPDAAEADAGADTAVLRQSMQDALLTLRRSAGGKGDHLYDLPWYVIIGPPGTGKTTALVNSGLKFPLSRAGVPDAVSGVGGTRYCDWWFTEEAVLIDTAGRYTTQDSDAKTDRAGWFAFLDLLKRNRPLQPINGVLVAVSCEDLMTAGADEIASQAASIRARIAELHERLHVEFPVYVLLTKADLVAGFMEFFGHQREAERREVWGHTFPVTDRTHNLVGDVPAAYDALLERLSALATDRLHDEATPDGRVRVFGFPAQMAMLKQKVIGFLNRVFEPTRYHANATLRGFYFTSGTQHGTPIDQLIHRLAADAGAGEAFDAAYSGKGKSFFLTDLLSKVIFGEAGWVSVNRREARRSLVFNGLAFLAVGLVSLAAAGLWWISFRLNDDLIDGTRAAVSEYGHVAAATLRGGVIADRDIHETLKPLGILRHLPAGHATREAPTPLAATFGLSQRSRLQSAGESAYHAALERMFRPRLILRLEEQIEANIDKPAFVYEALKVYLMLGGQAGRSDKALITEWLRRDWADNLYPGAVNARGREALAEHLGAMFDLDEGDTPLVALNGPLIEQAQKTLTRLSISERAYELLKSQVRTDGGADWVARLGGGIDIDNVFETADGRAMDTVRVPFLYTYAGFHDAFVPRLRNIGAHIEGERWVLGEAGQQAAVGEQYASLVSDVMRLYSRDFVAAWQQALGRIRMKSLTADKPQYAVLNAAAARTSPIRLLLESIREETRLTAERPAAQAGAAGGGERSPTAGATGLIGDAAPTGGVIEAAFRTFHLPVEGDAGQRPIDALLQYLGEISHAVAVAATAQAGDAQAAALAPQIAGLRNVAQRFPPPFQQMIRTAAGAFEGDATGASVQKLRQSLNAEVTSACQRVVANRYPFAPGSSREVPLSDFARLFSPDGIIDQFFKRELAPFVDQGGTQWQVRPDSYPARVISNATLREFQRAAEIRDAFFPTGSGLPSFTVTVAPLQGAANARIEINGTVLGDRRNTQGPFNLQWPGAGIGRTAVTVGGGFFSRESTLEWQGVWSLMRMLDAGTTLKQGDSVITTLSVGGQSVSFQFHVSSLNNPLALPALREFRCPSSS